MSSQMGLLLLIEIGDPDFLARLRPLQTISGLPQEILDWFRNSDILLMGGP